MEKRVIGDNRVMRTLIPAFLLAAAGIAQVPGPLAPYVKYGDPVLVLNHVRVIDGTGAAPAEDMRLDIEGGKILRVQSAKAGDAYPAGARVIDLAGKTVIPGLVGMHEHLFYPVPKGAAGRLPLYGEMADSAPRLYLAGGVTTARTAGSVEPVTDLAVKRLIDAGQIPGPRLDVTGPYLGGLANLIPQLRTLTGPEDAARTVDYWATQGVTSFKAYMDIKPEELKAAIERAHARGIKVTGHLCAVGFREAAALGIDNLEHGLIVDSEFFPGKKPGQCPPQGAMNADLAANVDVNGSGVQQTIRELVARHVAVTSTLAIFETMAPNRPPMEIELRSRDALSESGWGDYITARARRAGAGDNMTQGAALLKKEMQFERAFVEAGGLLMAGADPTGYGGAVPGFADERNLELLVEAGFTPAQAIHIATLNGAVFLGVAQSRGSIAAGMAADLVVVNGDPSKQIRSVEAVDTVFKDGIGYDPAKLRDSVRGLYGLR